jgi:acyl-CoA thioesterase
MARGEDSMGTFARDTAVFRDGDGFRATLDPDWCVWSPAGGYLLAILLRTAGLASEFPKPVSMSCHFLAAPQFGEVTLTATSLRKTRIAESLHVAMRQGERAILDALLWVGETVPGYEQADARPPDVPRHETLTARAIPKVTGGMHTMWSHLEHRPCGIGAAERKEPGEPRQRDWIRLRDFEPDKDAFLDAGRLALVLDSYTWPAAAHAHAGDARFIAPTLSFSIEFLQTTSSEWVLSDAYAPLASDGRIGITNRVWSPEGRLLALGNGTLVCRPRKL